MKICYLIAAHTDPTHLHRLIESLRISDITDFFIHLDKRADIHKFDLHEHDVTFLPNRNSVNWGTYSQCIYQKELIKACIESGNNYDRIFFLSGLDYPYWSNLRIIDFLNYNQNKELICGLNLTDSELSKQREKVTIYHLRDLSFQNKWLRRIFSVGLIKLMRIFPIRKKPYIIVDGEKQKIYNGSSWWCLTGDCLRYVYENLSHYEQYFKWSFTPDEMLIQTIVFNSPFRENAILYEGAYPGLAKLTPLHLIEYNKEIKIWDESDIEEIEYSDKMFIRKTVTGKSDRLMDIIDYKRKKG